MAIVVPPVRPLDHLAGGGGLADRRPVHRRGIARRGDAKTNSRCHDGSDHDCTHVTLLGCREALAGRPDVLALGDR